MLKANLNMAVTCLFFNRNILVHLLTVTGPETNETMSMSTSIIYKQYISHMLEEFQSKEQTEP